MESTETLRFCPTSGAVVADFVVTSGRSVVLDLSGFESGAAQDRFAADFAERLYRSKSTDRATLHVMVDEADSFAPQRPMPSQARMLGAFEAIVRRGRSRGLGMTLISQRPAVLNKNVLSQADLIICGRVVGPHDHKALLDWAKLYGSAEQLEQFTRTLPQLKTGEVWCWSPEWLGEFRRLKISRRVSFDSSSTPEPGAKRPTARMVEVDLADLSREIQSTFETAAASDPRALRKKLERAELNIAELRREAGVENEGDLLLWIREHRKGKDARSKVQLVLKEAQIDRLKKLADNIISAIASTKPAETHTPKALPAAGIQAAIKPNGSSGETRATSNSGSRSTGGAGGAESASLGKAERAILTVLRQYDPAPVAKRRVALIAGYSVGGGGFNNPLSKLRTQGMILGSDPLQITAAGKSAIGIVAPLPTGEQLLDYWCHQLGKAEGLILRALAKSPEGALGKNTLADVTGYNAQGGGFNNPLSKLRTLELISGSGILTIAEDLR